MRIQSTLSPGPSVPGREHKVANMLARLDHQLQKVADKLDTGAAPGQLRKAVRLTAQAASWGIVTPPPTDPTPPTGADASAVSEDVPLDVTA